MNGLQLTGILAGCLIGAGVVLLLIVVRLKSYAKESPSVNPADCSPDDAADERRQVHADVHELMGQLDALAGQIDERIELRLGELRQLMAEVDGKIAQGREAIDTHEPPHQSGIPVESHRATIDPRHEEILHLKSQGLDTIEIARRTQMNVGEVELVLNLHPARGQELSTEC